MSSINKLTPCTVFLSVAVFCWNVLQMKAVDASMVCRVYCTPISLTNRAPPAVLAAVLVTVYVTAKIPCTADSISKEENIKTKLAISLIFF